MSDTGKSAIDQGELVLYTSEDGSATFFLRAQGGTVWLTQVELAELFQSSVPNVNIHIKNILEEGELQAEGTIKEDLIVRIEGARQVKRPVKLYNLDMILAIGYRVKSPRGTQFRQWATTHLREYLVKGFVMDDARMKDPVGWDYFDELLERIREIRTSEKRFYQKVRDLFALSVDYNVDGGAVGHFFAEVQNKMLYAVTQQTAAELIVTRADPGQPNMALTAWKAERIRKTDVIVAKNYLKAEEIDHLNRMVTAFLEFAELRIRQRKQLTMADWRQYVDNFIQFNESPLLKGAGRISHEAMLKIAYERYGEFDGQRRKAEAIDADSVDMKELEQVEKQLNKKGGA
ncbi:virulence RhuM family protein [Janthinobacterium agaricidamnosum]|uniref:Putative DNA-binding protein n=1 Tax=Janthinobacterium agaricidamnosum NBRC 102515 = DSM 9628 TaxID=1349767 RepID=W0VEW6_9BURK|nr:virulence RhuM family protein [Janthinobacterium agaricidamnosum]CDG85892.1 putative DNA-binding protein [Janthinobacterium agaricidamnosum NBRC 102515 = DSM 9628]